MEQADLIVTGIAEMATLAGSRKPRRKAEMAEIGLVRDAAVAVRAGRIAAAGPRADVLGRFEAQGTIDAKGAVATPGLVDPHTHLVFAGSREDEFERRLAGATYKEIALAGGGIRSTVRAVRKALVPDLVALALPRLDRMLAHGTTTAEAKSGYGLSLEVERRQLEAITELRKRHAVRLVATNLCAHEVPDERRADRAAYIRHVLDDMLPGLRAYSEFFDVFCEPHVFTVAESREMLQRARDLGYGLKLHADEIEPCGGAELAVEMGAASADHLVAVSVEGIARLAASGTVAVLLPGTSFYLRSKSHAPARRMIDAGVAVAIATDANPGSSLTESLPLMMTFACVNLGLTPAEALTAATINAAHAISRAHEIGSLEPGKRADLVLWDAPSVRYLPSHYGVSLVRRVLVDGRTVHEAERRA